MLPLFTKNLAVVTTSLFFLLLKYLSFLQEYPKKIQKLSPHFENPLAPYETVLKYQHLSNAAKKILKSNGFKSTNYSAKKLIADYRPRLDYVVHIANLK